MPVGEIVGGASAPTSGVAICQMAVAAEAAPTVHPAGPMQCLLENRPHAMPAGEIVGGASAPTSGVAICQMAVAAEAAPTVHPAGPMQCLLENRLRAMPAGEIVGGASAPTSGAAICQMAVAAEAAPTVHPDRAAPRRTAPAVRPPCDALRQAAAAHLAHSPCTSSVCACGWKPRALARASSWATTSRSSSSTALWQRSQIRNGTECWLLLGW